MNTFFSITTILAAILAVGSIEDCEVIVLVMKTGQCSLFGLTIMLISGIMTILTLNKGQ